MAMPVVPLDRFPQCAKGKAMAALESYWNGVVSAQNRQLCKNIRKLKVGF